MFTGFSPSDIIIVIISLILSVAFHEAMHAFVAYKLGDDTAAEEGRLTLNPLKHIDLYMTVLLPAVLILLHLPPIFVAKPVPFDPSRVRFGEYGAALVALAGPFSNLLLAAIVATLLKAGILGAGLIEASLLFIQINISLFVFNMLPIPPLDGSRLVYAFAPEPVQRVMARIESMGLIVVFAIVLLLSQFISPILVTVGRAIFDFLL
jgi:Zn-dependent protease